MPLRWPSSPPVEEPDSLSMMSFTLAPGAILPSSQASLSRPCLVSGFVILKPVPVKWSVQAVTTMVSSAVTPPQNLLEPLVSTPAVCNASRNEVNFFGDLNDILCLSNQPTSRLSLLLSDCMRMCQHV